MSPLKKILRLSLLYLVMAGVLLMNSGFFRAEASRPEPLLARVPRAIDSWRGVDMEPERAQEVFSVKDSKGFYPLIRAYVKKGGHPRVILSALEDLKGFQTEIHDPRLCYESQGWTVLREDEIPLEGEKRAPGSMKLLVYASSRSKKVRMELFGYITGDRILTSDVRLRLAHMRQRLKKVLGRPREHVVYFSLSTDLDGEDRGSALGHLKELASRIAGALLGPGRRA